MNLEQTLKSLEYQLCVLRKKVDKLLLIKVNAIDNKLQSILDFTDSDTAQFEYLVDGKVTVHTNNSSELDLVDNYVDMIASGPKRFIYVITDENNNGDSSIYVYNGTIIKFVTTLPE